LADDLRARGIGQALQLLEVLVDMQRVVRALTGSPDEEGAFYGRLNVDQLTDTAFSLPAV